MDHGVCLSSLLVVTPGGVEKSYRRATVAGETGFPQEKSFIAGFFEGGIAQLRLP
jgi:hypothetical protein